MSRYVVQAGWDHAPHLDEKAKKELLESIPHNQREARSKGIPVLGSGAIYPIPEEEIVVPAFQLPAYYPRLYGLDVGWNKTACIWGAWDRESDIIYLYSEHYRGQAEPSVHASAVKARGDWIPGVIDSAANGRSQTDGKQLFRMYTDAGLNIRNADKAIEAGLHEVYERLATGRLKIFNTLNNTLSEYRIYRRDEKGKIVKQNDHLMDALRYLIMGIKHAETKPIPKVTGPKRFVGDRVTGY